MSLQYNPLTCAEVTFNTRGNEKQKQCARYWIDPVVEQILYGGSKYCAKSNTGSNLIFGDALMYPDSRYFIARESLTDLRRYTIPSIHEVFELWGLDHTKYMRFNGQDNFFILYNKSVVDFLDASYSPSDPDFHRFGSRQYTRGWCEEIGDMHESAITNLFLTVGRWKNREYNLPKKMLLTCNPHKGYGYQKFYKPHKEDKLPPDKKFISALPSDNKAGDPEYIKSLYNIENQNERERLAYGNWEYSLDPYRLIDYEKILDCFTNTHLPEGDKFISSDIARLGGDKIVIIEWSGFRGKITYYQKQTLDVTTTQIAAAMVRNQTGHSNVIVDSDGLGGGPVDMLRVKGFTNNARPMPAPNSGYDSKGHPIVENFDNIKSQCSFRMAERINKNGLYLECESDEVKKWVIEEMEQVKQKLLNSDMKQGVMPKDKIKEVLGRSPDFWDAIMMREYFELSPTRIFSDAEY